MGSAEQLEQFMGHFPGLTLEPPLFYNWPFALRFELAGSSHIGENRVSTILENAQDIFSYIFSPKDLVLAVNAYVEPDEEDLGQPAWQQILLQNIQNAKLRKQIEESGFTSIYEDADTGDEFVYVWHQDILACTPEDIDILSALRGIVDYEEEPAEELFFLHLEKKLIAHVYLEGGMDIIAADKSTLLPLYNRFQNLLLDFDRKRMEGLF